jgi:hypothetical protein
MKLTSFGIQNTKLGPNLWLTKRLGVFLQEYRGQRVKTKDDGLILRKLGVFLANLPCEGVSANLNHAITYQRLGLDLSEQASACGSS